MINMEATKIAYHATDNDVKIYMETSNGVQLNNKDYNKVVLLLFSLQKHFLKIYDQFKLGCRTLSFELS